MNKKLLSGCCSGNTITLVGNLGEKIWLIRIDTEIGEEFYFNVFDFDQFNPNPETFVFDIVLKKDIDSLKSGEINELIVKPYPYKTIENEFVDNDQEEYLTIYNSKYFKDRFVAYVAKPGLDNIMSFQISKDWFK
jgi:hypothetical protein